MFRREEEPARGGWQSFARYYDKDGDCMNILRLLPPLVATACWRDGMVPLLLESYCGRIIFDYSFYRIVFF